MFVGGKVVRGKAFDVGHSHEGLDPHLLFATFDFYDVGTVWKAAYCAAASFQELIRDYFRLFAGIT